ncbi:hypothetical protein FCV25MIE_32872 [Fagus crenata]
MVPHIVGLLMSHLCCSWLLLTRQSSFRYNILFPIPKREWDSASATSISITSSIESNFPNWAVASKLQQPSKEESLATLLAWFPNQPSSLKDKSFRDNNTNNNNSKITTFSTGSSANGKCQLGSSSLGKKSSTADIVVEDDESPNSQATASASSFDRKVSRSRSVGCGSRSFFGDFFERISTGFGDCTLRRVESQRHPKTVNALAHEVRERHGLDLTSQSFFDLSSAASPSISAPPLRL